MSLSKKRLKELENMLWFVNPKGRYVQRSIADHLLSGGFSGIELEEKTILYDGKHISGFFIGKNLEVVMWLEKNNDLEGFEAYHSNFREGPWVKWMEMKKTPAEKLRDHPTTKKLRARDGLGPKPATMFRSRIRR